MIGALRGEILELGPAGESAAELILDVSGVGYRVTISARHAQTIGVVGDRVALSIHTHVREGAIQLFGFEDSTERGSFELLLTAHGVGPALALAVLSVLPPPSLSRAIAAGDLDALMLVPGVGRKTAQRLQLELAQKLEVMAVLPSGSDAVMIGNPVHAELREALTALGYAPDEIRGTIEALSDGADVETMLREALSLLAPSR